MERATSPPYARVCPVLSSEATHAATLLSRQGPQIERGAIATATASTRRSGRPELMRHHMRE
jgi:hypothetical protein